MMPVIQILLVCIWNLDLVWTRVFVGCYGVKMKLYFHCKGIIFTVVPFVDYLSHLERGLYNVVYNLCPIPLSFCNKICLI